MIWAAAAVITVATALWQRMSGPSYPARGKVMLAGEELRYRLPRSHAGASDAPVRIAAPAGVEGRMEWRRYPTNDAWQSVALAREGDELVAALPQQPPAGKVDYRVTLVRGEAAVELNQGAPVRLRFRGDVPAAVLVVHVIAMFTGMLISTRAGLGALLKEAGAARWALPAFGLLTVGGMILGPVVQKYAFDAYWTGWPLGTDLTDNKTAVAWLVWLVAWRWPTRAKLVTAAAVTLLIFGIPHSVFGSQLRYSETGSTAPLRQRVFSAERRPARSSTAWAVWRRSPVAVLSAASQSPRAEWRKR